MKKLDWLILLSAILLSFAFGAAGLNADILFVDEYWSLRNSGALFGPLDLQGIWERTAYLDPAGMGIFYYSLVGGWTRLLGNSEFALRSLSLLVGVLSIATCFQLGRKLFSARIGLYTALFIASSAFFIDYLHEGRAYSLLVGLSAFAVYSYAQIMLSHRPAWFWYPILSLSLAALAYTHYVALSMGLVLGIIHLTRFRMSRRWFAVIFAMLIGGLLYLPWLSVALEVIQRGSVDTGRQTVAMNAWQIIESLVHSFSNANLALFVFLAFCSFRNWQKNHLVPWIYLLVGLLVVILVNSLIPFMLHIRYLIFVWPALALITALGIANMQPYGRAALSIWLLLGFYQAWQGDFISDLHGHIYRAPMAGFSLALETLNQRAESGDMALFHIIQPENEHLNYFPLAYYVEFPPLDRLGLAYEQFERVGNSIANADNEYFEDVNRVFEPIEAVWTIRNPQIPTTQKTEVVNFVLRSQFLRCETVFERDDMLMALYVRPPEENALGSYANDGLRLYDMGRGYQDATVSHWVLAWESANLAADTYSVGLHLYDMLGNFVTQQDFPLPNERPYGCIGVSLPIASVASGEYHLNVVVYNWQTGERLLSAEGDTVQVGMIVVP